MEDILQGSDEWKQLKCGIISGSHMNDVMSEKKGTGYENYVYQLVCERLNNCPTETTFSSPYMDRGVEEEYLARSCYSFVTGNEVEQVAFIKHPTMEFFGISPDGLIGADGGLEIKRKIPAIHAKYIRKNVVPTEYVKQMVAGMACTGRAWWDFCSYCPEFPENMQLFVVRLHRDEVAIKAMEEAVVAFNKVVESAIADLKILRP